MNSLEHYLSLNYKIEVVKDDAEGGYVAVHPQLKGCMTCAKDIETAVAMLEDARREWLSAALEEGISSIPEPHSGEQFSGQFKLRIPKSLHRELAEESKREGISMNQYCLYLLSKKRRAGSRAAETIEQYQRVSDTSTDARFCMPLRAGVWNG